MSNPSEKPSSLEQMSTERSDTGVSDPERTKTYNPEGKCETPIGPGPPRLLGEYELLERLGSGGMGEVYKARHRRLGKLVALKLLSAGTQHNPERLARFLREMRAIGELDHPNVVEAHDAGEQDGIVYLVMKLVPGTDLSALVRQRGPLPIAEACELTRQAAVGLQYLHERGLVHRDIKPSNLMRTPDGVVKILDLGLARWLEAPVGGEELTESGQPMGTPDYLAPEQAQSAAEVDVRADLYGLGATLYCLLTGRAPFAHRTGVYEKLWAHQTETPIDVRSVRPEVPAELAELLARMLAKRRQDRPESPAVVAAALAPFASGCMDVTPLPRRPCSGKARRIAVATAATGLALLLTLPLELIRRDPPREPVMRAPSVEKIAEPPREEQVRVVSLEVQHFASIGGGGMRGEHPNGVLGRDSFDTYREDSVTVTANLSRPAYAFLIAFRPDGSDEVCFPNMASEPPSLTSQPRYPLTGQGVKYSLSRGEGLHVFAVVVSSQPLPAYREWRAQRGASPWKGHAATPGVVWYDDGTKITARTDPDLKASRGKSQHIQGEEPLAQLTEWLRRSKDIGTVAAVAFSVRKKEELP